MPATISSAAALALKWLLTSGLRILLITALAFVAFRFLRLLTDRLRSVLQGVTPSIERQKRAHTLSGIVRAIAAFVVLAVAGMLLLQEVGVSLGPIIATAGITAGQRVLIHAASGGVGSIAVQLAKSRGAYVIATTSERNIALVKSLGADEVVDYHAQKFEQVARGMDAVFDTVGGLVQETSWQVLKPGGILVSIISTPSAEKARTLGVRSAFLFIEPSAAILAQLAQLVESGQLRPVIGAEFALKDIAKAHALSQSGHAVGKIVLYAGQP